MYICVHDIIDKKIKVGSSRDLTNTYLLRRIAGAHYFSTTTALKSKPRQAVVHIPHVRKSSTAVVEYIIYVFFCVE